MTSARQMGRCRGTGRNADFLCPFEPFEFDVGDAVDQVSRLSGHFSDHLYEAIGIVAARVADDEHDVGFLGLFGRSFLAHLRRQANFVVHLDVRPFLSNGIDHMFGIPHAQRRLCGHSELFGGNVKLIDVFGPLDQMNAVGSLADDAVGFGVAAFADIQDVIAAGSQAL